MFELLDGNTVTFAWTARKREKIKNTALIAAGDGSGGWERGVIEH